MNHITLLENGGTVLVVGGWNKAWQSFRGNPRIIFWTGDQNEIARTVRRQSIPQNCKAVIVSRFISHTELGLILQDVRKRRLTLFPNKSDGEVTDLLSNMLSYVEEVEGNQFVVSSEPVTEEPSPQEPETVIQETTEEIPVTKKKPVKKGELNKLIPFVNWEETNYANARALIKVARTDFDIQTTEDSLAQFIRVQRHKLGKKNVGSRGTTRTTNVVKLVQPAPRKGNEDVDVTVKMFDELISDLSEIRNFLVKVTEENAQLKAEHEKIAPLLAAIRGLK